MAAWRAELQNYHIKPGFPRTLGGANVVATDSEKRKVGGDQKAKGERILDSCSCRFMSLVVNSMTWICRATGTQLEAVLSSSAVWTPKTRLQENTGMKDLLRPVDGLLESHLSLRILPFFKQIHIWTMIELDIQHHLRGITSVGGASAVRSLFTSELWTFDGTGPNALHLRPRILYEEEYRVSALHFKPRILPKGGLQEVSAIHLRPRILHEEDYRWSPPSTSGLGSFTNTIYCQWAEDGYLD
ncbi:hypothetical protein EYF80_019656 [Liparis tanakae]|uniref:Uncharacterized protein n=1 Tax=Liparis tanakae TaxID=230148 RepID=A0A4Z2HXU5_9TELE|nr:hypothetical protein EYF80_019656 [Liparis tanakae]